MTCIRKHLSAKDTYVCMLHIMSQQKSEPIFVHNTDVNVKFEYVLNRLLSLSSNDTDVNDANVSAEANSIMPGRVSSVRIVWCFHSAPPL